MVLLTIQFIVEACEDRKGAPERGSFQRVLFSGDADFGGPAPIPSRNRLERNNRVCGSAALFPSNNMGPTRGCSVQGAMHIGRGGLLRGDGGSLVLWRCGVEAG